MNLFNISSERFSKQLNKAGNFDESKIKRDEKGRFAVGVGSAALIGAGLGSGIGTILSQSARLKPALIGAGVGAAALSGKALLDRAIGREESDKWFRRGLGAAAITGLLGAAAAGHPMLRRLDPGLRRMVLAQRFQAARAATTPKAVAARSSSASFADSARAAGAATVNLGRSKPFVNVTRVQLGQVSPAARRRAEQYLRTRRPRK